MKNTRFVIIIIIVMITFSLFAQEPSSEKKASPYLGKKVLFVNSYHAGYGATPQKIESALSILKSADVDVHVAHMDTKRNRSKVFKKQAGLKVKAEIKQWKPDLVIAADDNASKYLVEPYYKNADLPFVFIGVNWDASKYGYPYKNATGQIEIEPIKSLILKLVQFSQGKRVGILTLDSLTDRISIKHYENILEIDFQKEVYVNTFKEWKKKYLSLQKQVDILILRNVKGIAGWNNEEAESFIMEHTLIPTGTTTPSSAPYAMVSYIKVIEEIGEYAGYTALKILSGTPPESIPIEKNKRAAIKLNLSIAKKLGIIFKTSLLKKAKIVRSP